MSFRSAIRSLLSGAMLCLLIQPVWAQLSFDSEEAAINALITEMDRIEREEGMGSPQALIPYNKSFIDLARQKQWRELELYAVHFQLIALSASDAYARMEELYNQYLPEALAHSDTRIGAAFYKAGLRVVANNGSLEALTALVNEVESFVERVDKDKVDQSASLLTLIGVAYSRLNLLENAIEYMFQAKNLLENTDHVQEFDLALNSIAMAYAELGQHESAIEYFQQIIARLEQRGETFNQAIVTYNVGSTYLILFSETADPAHQELAREHLEVAVTLSSQVKDYASVAYGQFTLSQIAYDQKQYESAKTLSEQALAFFRENEDHRMLANTMVSTATANIQLGNVEVARILLRESDTVLNEHPVKIVRQYYYKALSELHEADGNAEEALSAFKLFYASREQELIDQKNSKVQGLLAQFDVEQKEAEYLLLDQKNQLLEREVELQSTQLERGKLSQYIMLIMMASGALVTAFLVAFFVREQKARKKYHELALTDPLTGSPNRRAILKKAELTLIDGGSSSTNVCLAVVDLDHFKSINDEYGHDVGDIVLKKFAKICDESLRRADAFGRIGGEEWLLVLNDASSEIVEQVFSRLQKKLSDVYIDTLDKSIHVTLSMGAVTISTAQPSDLKGLLKQADSNVYAAKENGRNQLVASSL